MSSDQPKSALVTSLKLIGALPFSVKRTLGRLFGRFFIRLDKRTVRGIDQNLALCFPNMALDERKALRNQRLVHIGQTGMEMLHAWTHTPEELLTLLEFGEGVDEFKHALESEQGVLLMAPHLGSWEYIPSFVSQMRTMTTMYRPQKDKAMDAFILESRKRAGTELAPTDRRGVMQLMKALKSGGVVGILPDQVPAEGSGEYVPFFGQPAYTMTLASQLTSKSGAKAFICAVFQTQKGLKFEVFPLNENFYSEDLQTSTASLNKSLEALILRHPEQYQWEYKRFKKQADGSSLYPRSSDND
ncbi:lysophospholipid acyltransferase family protein [Marinomonas mediterranea]|uniref:lysophospholipid acyltransferase family protein n=1 Tax=Marinomonas mediterranea TaxID=119864 RepID=UPI00234AC08A|nr:lysophospholipid acyltransferase family protein [Marinomonas mediterranea]WCN07418.1 lipid A biosynthesis acyltransferase [Marinomonas mediterranea]WCN11512.1 lipid A biosynthesis acyltransferase [Marinomonas mediterranea]